VLRLAGGVAVGAAGAGALAASGGCEARSGDRSPTRAAPPGDVLVVELAAGALAAIDATTGRVLVGAAPSVLSGDGTRLVRAEQPGSGTRLTSHRLTDGAAVSGGTLTDRLAVRATSPDGSLVALATPAGATPASTGSPGANPAGPGTSPYRPAARERTTIVVAGSAGQRNRVELPGNLEPEAFDVSGHFLFVLDYLPPTAPDRYRVRAVDLASGQLQPLLTRVKTAVPGGAEEEMRGEGRQAVYDPRRRLLFTLYTHQPDHLHTRDLIAGARPDAPHVHAFVHTLNLTERWAFCVDLPAPFGEQAAAGHAIALGPDGGTLYVVDATSGTVAAIDPDALTVSGTARFTPPAAPATPAAVAFGGAGALLVGAGREVVTGSPTGGGSATRWSTDSRVRGLAGTADGARLYVGQDGAVVRVDAATGAVRRRINVPGLVALRQVVARA